MNSFTLYLPLGLKRTLLFLKTHVEYTLITFSKIKLHRTEIMATTYSFVTWSSTSSLFRQLYLQVSLGTGSDPLHGTGPEGFLPPLTDFSFNFSLLISDTGGLQNRYVHSIQIMCLLDSDNVILYSDDIFTVIRSCFFLC